MQRNPVLDFKVGIFVFIGLIILVVLILFIGDFRIFKPGYTIDLIFGSAGELKKNSPVSFAGVEAGLVKDIRLIFDPDEQKVKVKIRVWIEKDAKISRDSQTVITTMGLLGEKFVAIFPGEDNTYFLQEGDVLIGEDPISMHEITSRLNKSIAMINEVVGDKKVRQDLKDTLNDTKLLLEQIRSGDGTLGKLIYDKQIYDDLEEFVADIKAHPWKLFFRQK